MQVDPIRVGRQDYLLAYCTNAPEGAETFQVFAGYLPPSFAGGEALDISRETPVCEGRVRPDLLELVPITREQREAGFFGAPSVILRDADGNILDAQGAGKDDPGQQSVRHLRPRRPPAPDLLRFLRPDPPPGRRDPPLLPPQMTLTAASA